MLRMLIGGRVRRQAVLHGSRVQRLILKIAALTRRSLHLAVIGSYSWMDVVHCEKEQMITWASHSDIRIQPLTGMRMGSGRLSGQRNRQSGIHR